MKKPKAKKAAAKPKADKSAKATNLIDPKLRAVFLSNKENYAKLMKRMGAVQKDLRQFGKTVKQDGFTMRQIKLAVQLETPEGEAVFKAAVAGDLLAAAYTGADIGEQLPLFLDEVRKPAVDRAFEEGQKAAMEDKPARPDYHPSTPQHASYMRGFHEATAQNNKKRIKEGIKAPTPAKVVNAKPMPKTAAQKAAAKEAKKTADKYVGADGTKPEKAPTGDFSGNA